MKRFLPFILALVFTALAVAMTMFVARPGIRAMRWPEGWRLKLAEVIDEVTESKEADR